MGAIARAATRSRHDIRWHYLTGLQVWQLKHLAINTGITPGTNKAATAANLLTGSHVQADGNRQNTIYKSVDMGVKNLAFSVIEPGFPNSAFMFRLLDWQRLNVLTADKAAMTAVEEESETDTEDTTTEDTDSTATTLTFNPASLAPAAARLARRLATEHQPTTILIERQRFRSGRGAAVQEWTLRVNSLEAMLWASLETMRTHSPAGSGAIFPTTIEMSPQRIAAFWNARGKDWSLTDEGLDALLPPETSQSKKRAVDAADGAAVKRGMEKAEKIALVKTWLEHGDVDVKAEVQPLANAFMHAGRASKAQGDLVIGKKDDLADCVVQGVTFGLWQRNRELLRQHLLSLSSA